MAARCLGFAENQQFWAINMMAIKKPYNRH